MNVLIAEDEKSTRIRLKSYLEKMGHGVVTAQNGAEAWEIFQNGDFPMVITDWMMPEMDGVELVRRIRGADRESYAYLILLTSRSEKDDIVEGMEAGADDFLGKPFDRNELRVRVGAGERIVKLESDLDQRNAEVQAAHERVLETNKQLETANARMKEDLLAAARIQHAFLPTEPPVYEGVSFAWDFHPCDELAGDMLNVIPFDDTRLGLYLLDVSGHGVRAALLAVTLSRMLSLDSTSIIREPVDDGSGFRVVPPAQVAARLNHHFDDMGRTEQFFTMVYGILNVETNEYRYVTAGHPAPICLTRANEPQFIHGDGFPIGITDTEFDEFSITLGSGDRLYLYSDGIPDTTDVNDDRYGADRLIEVLAGNHSRPLGDSLAALKHELEQWRGDAPVTDDVSILGAEFV